MEAYRAAPWFKEEWSSSCPHVFCLTRSARRPSEAGRLEHSVRQERRQPGPALRPQSRGDRDAKRRTFTVEYKIRILKEAEAAKD